MRAFQVLSAGQAAALTDCPTPEPGAGEIRVKIEACGLNFADLLMEEGKYQDTPQAPFVLGMEVAGVVDALGPGVAGPAAGTRVAVFGGQGGLAEYGCFPADRAVPLPDAMSAEDAAAFQIAYGTSHLALDHRARMQPGETLLVLGAAGGRRQTSPGLVGRCQEYSGGHDEPQASGRFCDQTCGREADANLLAGRWN